MGGGDLNQKKSWHPHTLKNQERVWKAEQAQNQEEKKLKELRREIEQEKEREELKKIGESSGVLSKPNGDNKLEWMYKKTNDLINRDEYLLGRTIDKSFEVLQAEEQQREQNIIGVKQPLNHVEYDVVPFSIRAYRNIESNEQVDLQRKVLEDPLMLIKQKEMESRRKILENPVKLKELHRILRTEQMLSKNKDSKKKKKSKKTKKKSKKRSKSSSDSESVSEHDDDLDAKLKKRYAKLQKSLQCEEVTDLNLEKLLDSKYDTLSKELDKAFKGRTKKKRSRKVNGESDSSIERQKPLTRESRQPHHTKNQRQKHKRSESREAINHQSRRSRPRESEKRVDRDLRNPSKYRKKDHLKRERSPDDIEQKNYDRPSSMFKSSRRPRSPEDKIMNDRKGRGSSSPRKRKRTPSPRRRSRSRSKEERHRPHSPSACKGKKEPETGVRNKMTEEEKEQKRRAMMENAAWREVDRAQAVNKHRAAYAKEEEQHRSRDFDKNFINKEVGKAIATHKSVETRIRSKLNNIQRSSAAMDSNFARK